MFCPDPLYVLYKYMYILCIYNIDTAYNIPCMETCWNITQIYGNSLWYTIYTFHI